MNEQTLYTVGHSNHETDEFIALLTQHAVTAIADVRSSPYSAYNPQFNRETLTAALNRAGIDYVFLGRELGARREEPDVYDDAGQVQFEAVAEQPLFRKGLERVIGGMQTRRIALMCAEKDPLTCHRTILVCRELAKNAELPITHIREDGSLEDHTTAESRLLRLCKLPEQDLFRSREELLDEAYEQRACRVAYTEKTPADALPGS